MRPRILSVIFICLFFAACSEKEQTDANSKTTEVKISPEKATKPETMPALKLSVDDITIDHQINDDDILNSNNQPAETQSELFEILNRDQTESDINLSGKVLTDEEKIDKKEYLDSVDGVQINIEGSFE